MAKADDIKWNEADDKEVEFQFPIEDPVIAAQTAVQAAAAGLQLVDGRLPTCVICTERLLGRISWGGCPGGQEHACHRLCLLSWMNRIAKCPLCNHKYKGD